MNTYRIRYTPHNATGPVRDKRIKAHDEQDALEKFLVARAGKAPVTVRVISVEG